MIINILHFNTFLIKQKIIKIVIKLVIKILYNKKSNKFVI